MVQIIKHYKNKVFNLYCIISSLGKFEDAREENILFITTKCQAKMFYVNLI